MATLVPATVRLVGRWNWWRPGWLDRALPKVAVDSVVESGDRPALAQVVASAAS